MIAPALVTVATVLGSAMLGGWLAKAARQPAVIGEMLAVIALGPALLGWMAPDAEAALFPKTLRPALGILSQLGVTAFMFLVGLELHLDRHRGREVASVTVFSLALPLTLGTIAALAIEDQHGSGPLWAFRLFVGGALSVTAVPVLALILKDRGLVGTPVGRAALAAAAASDVLAWILLALVSVSAGGAHVPASERVAALVALILGVALVHLLLGRLERRGILGRLHPTTLVGGALVAVVASAVASDAAGLHTVIGPLLLGVAVPRAARLSEVLEQTLGHVARAALLPFFFLTAGLAIDVSSLTLPMMTVSLLVLASLGKIGGTLAAARLTRLGWSDAWRLGVLLNTRGLTELVFLATGLQLGIIRPPLYTALVIVTLVTTIATGPLLDLGGNARSRLVPAAE